MYRPKDTDYRAYTHKAEGRQRTYILIDFVVHVAEVELERVGPNFVLDRFSDLVHSSVGVVREPREERWL